MGKITHKTNTKEEQTSKSDHGRKFKEFFSVSIFDYI
jgi:hypothetical protein